MVSTVIAWVWWRSDDSRDSELEKVSCDAYRCDMYICMIFPYSVHMV